MRKRICLLTGSHLCHNPRALKEADALARAGYEVTVLGAWIDAAQKQRDEALLQGARFRYVPAADLTGRNGSARLRRFLARVRTKAANALARSTSIESGHQLGWIAGPLAVPSRPVG